MFNINTLLRVLKVTTAFRRRRRRRKKKKKKKSTTKAMNAMLFIC
jgi:hypothetical protein